MARARGAWKLGTRIAPARFLLFLAVLAIVGLGFVILGVSIQDALEYAFDIAVVTFLGSLWPLLKDAGAPEMRRHSSENEANRPLVLGITMVMSVAVFAAIVGDLKYAKAGSLVAMGTLIATLTLAWAFTNAVFALHYAHAFYSKAPKEGGDVGGIDFPGTKEPDYWDFLYLSFTLGMSFGTPDVNLSRGAVRRVVMAQCFVAFIFNIGVVAFIINALGGGK